MLLCRSCNARWLTGTAVTLTGTRTCWRANGNCWRWSSIGFASSFSRCSSSSRHSLSSGIRCWRCWCPTSADWPCPLDNWPTHTDRLRGSLPSLCAIHWDDKMWRLCSWSPVARFQLWYLQNCSILLCRELNIFAVINWDASNWICQAYNPTVTYRQYFLVCYFNLFTFLPLKPGGVSCARNCISFVTTAVLFPVILSECDSDTEVDGRNVRNKLDVFVQLRFVYGIASHGFGLAIGQPVVDRLTCWVRMVDSMLNLAMHTKLDFRSNLVRACWYITNHVYL